MQLIALIITLLLLAHAKAQLQLDSDAELLPGSDVEADSQPEPIAEQDRSNCPSSCSCQYAAYNELPIARWINHMTSSDNDADSTLEDTDFLMLSKIKLATCLLQDEHETQELFNALPLDLQALILLHGGNAESQLTMNTSSLRGLNQLMTLEIRGNGITTLIIDEPLEFLQHANFEALRLQASDRLKRPKYSKLPSDDYEYKPPRDVAANEVTPKYELQFESDDVVEIMSYEQHVERLKQTRMPSFYGWSRLEVLRIHSCNFNELHWQMFDGLTQLHHLSLERNGIEELQPFAFSGAPHLRSLSLAHNAVARLYYLGLAGLLELETLNLSDNRLERLSESSFPPLPHLLKADLRQNPIMYILPATFWVMNDTRELQLGSELAALELRSWNSYGQFDSLHKLRTLRLGNVSTASLEQGVFKGLHAVEQLTLRGNILSVQFDAFAGMEQLRELDMSHCGITELSMDAFMGAKQLQLLNLSHNNLTHVPNGLLDEQTQLEMVQLQNNQLTTLPTSFFLQPRLRVARLDQNPWQCSCDMSNWKPRMTNTIRLPSVRSCVRDLNGQEILCRHVVGYETDKNLVPRCANHNGRSVYYVLRKQLHCGATRIFGHSKGSSTRGLPHWRKIELQQQQQRQQQKPKQKRKQHKKPRKSHGSQRNSLHFVLSHQKEPQQKQQQQQQHEASLSQEMSNEI
ncbi:carboxypeptidase N subunit 2-like [Drosophila albomicans]|uniref:Carboxypeptidase N subunit 2-like n=1 Tax=Drosophila albomicans TaxID=7291 RepID=A0A6P8WB01_DROAB|nr:carboxypeptidase N subunit 2-like [Drosophila albomicans]